MKFSILGFDQKKVLDLTEKVNCNKKEDDKSFLDIDDLLILSVISDLSNRISIRKVILEDGQYSWISYNTILEDLPILRISKKQLRRKLDKLVEFNLIELRVERVKDSGTFVYIKLGKEYERLLYDNTYGQKCPEGEGENVYGDGQKCPPKDNITIQDNNNKEERDKSLSKKATNANAEVDDFIERMYALYPTKCPIQNRSLGKTSKDKDRIRKLLKIYSKEDIEFVIKYEVSQKYNKSWMSNFSTFLNNFPDPTQIDGYKQNDNDEKEEKELIINGQVYR